MHSFSRYSNVSESFTHLWFSFIRNWRYEDSSWRSIQLVGIRHKTSHYTSFRHGIDIDKISCSCNTARMRAARTYYFLLYVCFSIYVYLSTKNQFENVIIIINSWRLNACTQRLWLNTKTTRQEFGTYMIKANNTKDIDGQKTTNLKKRLNDYTFELFIVMQIYLHNKYNYYAENNIQNFFVLREWIEHCGLSHYSHRKYRYTTFKYTLW